MQIYKTAGILAIALSLSQIAPCAMANSVTVDITSNVDTAFLKAFNSYLQENSSSQDTFDDIKQLDKLVKNAYIKGNKLNVLFDETLLNDFMQDRNIVKFEQINEPILVWLTKVGDSQTTIVTDTNDTALTANLSEVSNKHNLRLMFPLMDLDDVQLVSANTILSHNDKALANASSRYGSNYFIAGALSYDNNNVFAKLNLFYKDGSLIESKSYSSFDTNGLNDAIKDIKVAIAKDLIKNRENSKQDALNTDANKDEPQETEDKVLLDDKLLGPSRDFVRFKIANITSLQDIAKIKHLFITYGYDDNAKIVRIEDGALIVELKTHSNPMILDGTMRKSGDFNKISAWTYTYKHAHKNISSYNTLIKKTKNSVFASDINTLNNIDSNNTLY